MKIINYDEIDSTQLEAKRLVEKNSDSAINGTIIVAQNQTGGIGTHGRKWTSKKDESVTFTIILKPDCELEKIESLTIKIAECIVQVFFELYGITLNIKEPNDIVFNDKKIGGILTECRTYKNIVKYIFIGIGLNTNQITFSGELQDIATSIKKEFNIDVENNIIIKEISKKLIG